MTCYSCPYILSNNINYCIRFSSNRRRISSCSKDKGWLLKGWNSTIMALISFA